VRWRAVGLVVSAVLLVCSCGGGRIDTAAKLAQALKREGIRFDGVYEVERERNKMSRLVDEAVSLEAESVWVEIFRIEKEKYFNMAAMAVGLRRGVESSMSGEVGDKLVDSYVRRPFVVMVMQEPEPGVVRAALKRILEPE
jgi:hypothetical protein